MQTKKVGEILKEERLRQQLTLQQLSDLTRIKVDFLRLLEKNEFVQLPSAIYVKGYIKAYSRVFDFDEKPLLALLKTQPSIREVSFFFTAVQPEKNIKINNNKIVLNLNIIYKLRIKN
jgi:cytoskeletal protein RodZ